MRGVENEPVAEDPEFASICEFDFETHFCFFQVFNWGGIGTGGDWEFGRVFMDDACLDGGKEVSRISQANDVIRALEELGFASHSCNRTIHKMSGSH